MSSHGKKAGFFGFFASGEQEIFRHIVESAPNAIVLVGHDGRIVLVNAQTERSFGYSRQELIGQPIELLVPARRMRIAPGSPSPSRITCTRWESN